MVLSIVLTVVGSIMLLFSASDPTSLIFYFGMALLIVGVAIITTVIILILVHVPNLEAKTPPEEHGPGICMRTNSSASPTTEYSS